MHSQPIQEQLSSIVLALFLVIAVPGASGMAAALLPFIVLNFLSPSIQSGAVGGFISGWFAISFCAGAGIGTFVWLRGLSHLAKLDVPKRADVPRRWFPPVDDRKSRVHMALNIYWHGQIPTAMICSSIYSVEVIFIAATQASGDKSTSQATSTSPETPALLAALAITALVLAPPMLGAFFAGHRVKRRMVAVEVYLEIVEILSLATLPDNDDGGSPELIADPSISYRDRLCKVVDLMIMAAAELDARQRQGFTPHPISTILRASAEELRIFLRSKLALSSEMPTHIVDTLTNVAVLLGSSRDPDLCQNIASQLFAFDESGHPAIEVTIRPPGRIHSFFVRTGTSIKGIAAVMASGATIFTVVVAMILSLLGRIDINTLLGHLR